ncbi:unnamed protein product [Pieris macdunnoughi]|uniref:Uncharacterized protein n=1 Tax=Pieris macdunnoughi TaxID=345717 RepID=A0A821NCV3_9NEOP|nr:unnamed protein product [Pieris macdunnoughi]
MKLRNADVYSNFNLNVIDILDNAIIVCARLDGGGLVRPRRTARPFGACAQRAHCILFNSLERTLMFFLSNS